eukprot:TRINITY_DN48882_c0_g1_i1.p1 TRINITY_DN48882_c0_g1~~TRINITY_DN48882_c0_g1_i1.p1  ORF type:complete len:368 (-),score=42.93 TRINITY_DN48882_c0_g1_i1:24-1127(-)
MSSASVASPLSSWLNCFAFVAENRSLRYERTLPSIPSIALERTLQFAHAMPSLAQAAAASPELLGMVKGIASERIRKTTEHVVLSDGAIPLLLRLGIHEALTVTHGGMINSQNAIDFAPSSNRFKLLWSGRGKARVLPMSRVLPTSWPPLARWPLLAGNDLSLGPKEYKERQASATDRIKMWIEKDVRRSTNFQFRNGLKHILLSLCETPEIGNYQGGMNHVVASTLMWFNGDEYLTFITMANFLVRTQMFRHGALEHRLQAFEDLLAYSDPKLAMALEERQLQSAMFAAGPLAIGFVPVYPTNGSRLRLWEDILTAKSPSELDERLTTEAVKRILRIRPKLYVLWKGKRSDEFETSIAILRNALEV